MQTAFFYTITLRLTKAQKRRNVLSENNVDSRGGTRAGKDVPPMLLFIYITNRVATVSPILQKMKFFLFYGNREHIKRVHTRNKNFRLRLFSRAQYIAAYRPPVPRAGK